MNINMMGEGRKEGKKGRKERNEGTKEGKTLVLLKPGQIAWLEEKRKEE